MYRALLCIIAAVLVCAPVGCRSCAHPFDYCGPTFTGDGCGPCDPNSRAGSILLMGGQEEVYGTTSPEPAPESAPLLSPERTGRSIEGPLLSSSGVQLIAETDRAVSPVDTKDAPILTPSQAPAKSSSQNGWTARKSRVTYR